MIELGVQRSLAHEQSGDLLVQLKVAGVQMHHCSWLWRLDASARTATARISPPIVANTRPGEGPLAYYIAQFK